MSWLDLLMQQFPMPSSAPSSGSFLPEPQSSGQGGFLPTSGGGGLPTFLPTPGGGGLPTFLPDSGGTGGSTFLGGGTNPVDAVMGILGGVGQRLGAARTVELAGAADAAAKAAAAKAKASAPAAPGGSGTAATGSASANNYAFAQQHMPLAQQAVQQAGVDLDPAIAAAVAANETQWGQAPQGGQPWNSFHGIRGTGTAGITPGGFRANLTPQDSYNQFVALVTNPNSVYGPAYQQYQQDHDANAFIQNIGRAGYALAGPEADAWIPQVQALLPQVQQQWKASPPPGSVQPIPNATYTPGAALAAGGNPWQIAFDFNQPYSTPLSGGTAVHRGVDLVIPGAANNGRGTPYQAFVPGVVTNLTEDPDGGHGIIVQSADGLYERYFHNDRVLVKVGDQVGRPGDPPIGIVGASGTEGFPHLHFEVSRGVNGDPQGQTIDPRPYLQRSPLQPQPLYWLPPGSPSQIVPIPTTTPLAPGENPLILLGQE